MKERDNNICEFAEFEDETKLYKCNRKFISPCEVCSYRKSSPLREWNNYCTDPDVIKQERIGKLSN